MGYGELREVAMTVGIEPAHRVLIKTGRRILSK